MMLSAMLAKFVDPEIQRRGQRYFASKRVTIKSVGEELAFTSVRGSRIYAVDLIVDGFAVLCWCNCPYVADRKEICKHIWASICAVEEKGFARMAVTIGQIRLVLDEVDQDDFDGESKRDQSLTRKPAPARKSAAPRQNPWKSQFATLCSEAGLPTSGGYPYHQGRNQRMVYIIDAAQSASSRKLVLEINVQERKKDGEWGKPRAHSVPLNRLVDTSDPHDSRILALLKGAESLSRYDGYYYSYGTKRYGIAEPLCEVILPLLAQTGRVYLRRPGERNTGLELLSAAIAETPWQIEIEITRCTSGAGWVLAGRLRRGEETLPLTEASLIVPGFIIVKGQFDRFGDAAAAQWTTALRQASAISVPKDAVDELLEQLIQAPHCPPLKLPRELQYAEELGSPEPHLVLRKASKYYGELMLHAELSFAYGGKEIPAQSNARGVFRHEDRRFLLRDLAAEHSAQQELYGLGAKLKHWGGQNVLELPSATLPRLVHSLIASGWIIEAEDKLYRKAGQFALAIRSGQDWFDLTGVVTFDDKPVPFPRLLDALRRGQEFVRLDDGSLGVVPEDWLKKYGMAMQLGTATDDGIRFSRSQLGVLDALLAARPEVRVDKMFDKARAELHKFTGIAPAEPPGKFCGQLRPYQQVGLGWLHFLRTFGFGGCLADEMGLGKTVQVLALLSGERRGTTLIVVPRSLVFNWIQEAKRFAPQLTVLDHTGPARDRSSARFDQFDIVLTTYGTLRNDAATFANFRFDTCVLDESQAAKNAMTETSKAVRIVQADHRLALSGTPVENHLGELWNLFDFLNPGMLGQKMIGGGGKKPIRNPDAEVRELLARALRPFILRRTKDEVATDLPRKTETTIYCDLDNDQRRLYDELRDHYRRSLLDRVEKVGMGRSKIQVLEALLRLRQAACHPGLIDKARTQFPSAKTDVLFPELQEILESGHKVLVFSQFTSLLSIIRERLDADGVIYEYLDGRTRDRAQRVERFQTDPACKLFLISLKAGGVGLNLTAAEYVFLLDPWWNPAVEAQAIDRTHRIGQTKPVFAYRLIARGTVEEKVLKLQEEKRDLADAILGGDYRIITDLKREDLELLLS